MGPQAGGGYINPTPQQPQGGDPMADWSMQNQAQQQALMHAMGGMLDQQYQGNLQNLGMQGARLGNSALGNPIGAALRPLGSAVKAGFSGAKNLVGLGAQQSYTQGGPVTVGATTAAETGLSAAPSATPAASSAVLDSAGPSIGSSLSSGLSLIGSGYAAYSGHQTATAALDRLHEAQSYGVSPEDEAALRQKTFNAGIVNSMIGSGAGLYGGGIPGMLLGGYGGAKQAFGAYDHPGDAIHAFAQFQRNPFAH